MKFGFVGDIAPLGKLDDYSFKNLKLKYNLDHLAGNLESPLTESSIVENKGILFAPMKNISILKNLGINIACLANNHIHDKGFKGLTDTISVLNKNNIYSLGAGTDLAHAEKPLKLNDQFFLINACQSNAPTLNLIKVASQSTWGVAHLDIHRIVEQIRKLPEEAKCILYFHSGREHISIPEMNLREIFYTLIDKCPNIELIISSHPHRIQGWEKYKDCNIFFSLGNFFFPDFYILPPQEIAYNIKEGVKYRTTYQYHKVKKTTLKKWKRINLQSIMVIYDTETREISIKLFRQKQNTITEMEGFERSILEFKLKVLNKIFGLPKLIYSIMAMINARVRFLFWYSGILLKNKI